MASKQISEEDTTQDSGNKKQKVEYSLNSVGYFYIRVYSFKENENQPSAIREKHSITLHTEYPVLVTWEINSRSRKTFQSVIAPYMDTMESLRRLSNVLNHLFTPYLEIEDMDENEIVHIPVSNIILDQHIGKTFDLYVKDVSISKKK